MDVFSGDDLVLMVDLGVEGLHKRQRVRLYGVDTPNAVNAGQDTDAGKVRALIRSMTRDRKVTLTVHSRVGTSWVGTVMVHTRDGDIQLNQFLIERGFSYQREKSAP
jgi:endonuclease YncB( thermonuclease family)